MNVSVIASGRGGGVAGDAYVNKLNEPPGSVCVCVVFVVPATQTVPWDAQKIEHMCRNEGQ